MTRYAVVIPAYNEASTIRDVASGALEHVRHVIVVDDGSVDGTQAALAGLPLHLLANPLAEGADADPGLRAQFRLRGHRRPPARARQHPARHGPARPGAQPSSY